MSVGAVARIVSIVLLLVLGGSGALVGLQLLGAMALIPGGQGASGAPIAGALGAYGLVLVAAAIGLVLGKRWARLLGIVAIVAGLGVLLTLLAISGAPDEILLGGVIIWAATLVCLLLTRRSAPV